MKKCLVLMGIMVFVYACTSSKYFKTNPDKVYSNLNIDENKYFWEQFHEGNISNLDSIIKKLEHQLTLDSNDLVANAHLGFAHMWGLSEWQRIPNVRPNVKDHAGLAYKYFTKAYDLNPNDARILGFLSDAQMAYGSISGSSKLQRKGYFKGLKSIKEWPEFNKFTIGVTFSSGKPDSKFFQKALDWQWTTLEDCYTTTIDRTDPKIQSFINAEYNHKNLGKDRACYNSWIAPHNIEGYFLHMGDMITKTGDYNLAKKIYELAKASPNFNTWVFKDVLEKRILNAEKNTTVFLAKNQKGIDNVIINNSGNLCMSCHKMSKEDFSMYKNYNWQDYFKSNDIYAISSDLK